MFTSLATNLGEDTIKDIQNLEREIGCPILAVSYHDLEAADLDRDKIVKLQEYEKSRGICLMAVKP